MDTTDWSNDIEHIKQTLVCIAVGCYINIVLSLCMLL